MSSGKGLGPNDNTSSRFSDCETVIGQCSSVLLY